MDEELDPTWCMLVKCSASKAEARSEEILIILWESSKGKASRGACRPVSSTANHFPRPS